MSKYIAFIIVIGISIFFIWVIGALLFVGNFHGDTFGKAEKYVIDINTKKNKKYKTSLDIVDFLYEFQCANPQYQLISTNLDGKEYHNFSHKTGNYYDQYLVFFYFKDIDMTFSCITEVTTKGNSVISLYAVNKGAIFRNWKRINNYKEISYRENKVMKERFEIEILNNLGVSWRHKKIWD